MGRGTIVIRKAEQSDRGQILELRILMQRHTESSSTKIWRVTEEGKVELEKEVDEMLADEEGRVLVAGEGGGLIGFVYGRVALGSAYVPGSVGFIQGIYVREPRRRRGIGTELVLELAKFFGSEGVEEANLSCVLGNGEAEAFWGALGFEPVIQIANTPLMALERRLRERRRERP